ELEELLITADLGPATAARIVNDFAQDKFDKDIDPEDVKVALAESVAEILTPVAKPLVIQKPDNGPFTILVCGVNGVGKTTTIGKLAQIYKQQSGLNVMLAAGDTFRAAAVEQLGIWAERTGSDFYSKELDSDAAAVAYEAYQQAKEKGADVLMIDTAGRLQNKSNLMEELAKIVRVLKKQDENLPHAVLLVLDATTGQNAHSQVQTFKDMVDVTGLIVTKLDGSARGGVVVSLAEQFGLPIHAIGVGERVQDLSPFNAEEFAKALIGLKV
ncbi:MAG: signal recognition particle-docking protein FtsY, partial [Pseudomonadota bacterium]